MWITTVAIAGSDLDNKFSDIRIEDAYRPYLAANSLLMEVTGARIIRLSPKKAVVIAVASTVIRDSSAEDRLRAEKVCRVKAIASVVAERQGVQVAHTEHLDEKTQIVLDRSGEKDTSISELLQITRTKDNGITKDMPVVGTWKSKDGDVFYLALGATIDVAEPVVKSDH